MLGIVTIQLDLQLNSNLLKLPTYALIGTNFQPPDVTVLGLNGK